MSSPFIEDLATDRPVTPSEAEAILRDLASVFVREPSRNGVPSNAGLPSPFPPDRGLPNLEAMYRTLVEQLPAVVFMAYLDRPIGEAYVSPRIEEALGFSQAEWLEDPVRWYHQIHPDDRQRWSIEAAEMFSSGKPLRSAYRVLCRDGRVIWFQCEVQMIRRDDGRPWFIHGVAFDITDLKRAEQALEEKRNQLAVILDTVGALVLMLDPTGRITGVNPACEQLSGYPSEEVCGRPFWELFLAEDAARVRELIQRLRAGQPVSNQENDWITKGGDRRRVVWSCTALADARSTPTTLIATGQDITERKRMERALLEISAREQRQIGQDLHDGLGQHLTGIAFMSKVLEQRLAAGGLDEAAAAGKIVRLVNEAIHRTRELARGLLPVVSEADGLMSALTHWAQEVEDLFHLSCRFECSEPVLIHDVDVATHLYHIAQEAVNNALKHAGATGMRLCLGRENGTGVLVIEDDGAGFPEPVREGGLGLHIMSYRAGMIGGTLDLRRGSSGGTIVSCRFPLHS